MAAPIFHHEKLKVYQDSLRFVEWATPVIERIPAKISAKDQLDRASTSIVLNIAEGNAKRSNPDRCRYFDTARGSGVECAACLDILHVKKRITAEEKDYGKSILLEVVSMTTGLMSRFSPVLAEEQAEYHANNGSGD